MRISDWSSDVCSSDLRHRPFSFEGGPPSVAGKTRAKAGATATGFGTADVLLLRGGSGRALRDLPCADRLARHILLLRQRFVVSDALLTIEETGALEALAERRKGIVGRRARERSEEHTSELQSLM